MHNSIVWGNLPDDYTSLGLTTETFTHCDIGGGFAGSGNFDADPLFVAAARGDFRLRGDSPCVDAGSPAVPLASMDDFEGDVRPIYNGVDIGADEMADVSRHPSAAGFVGLGQGGPYDVLTIDGTGGGFSRRVNVDLGTPVRVEMAQPPTNPSPARFAFFGLLRAARHDDPVSLPAGLGAMSFPPCIFLPSAFPFLFTLTNNGILGPCGQLMPSTPTPWTSPPGAIPFPLELTLQGVIEETPGVLRVTNAVMLSIG